MNHVDRDGMAELPPALRGHFDRYPIYDVADWYDVDYAGYRAELPFYRFLVDRYGGGQPVVELGAGTGRIALALAESGTRVHAVEPAIAMRARLEADAARRGLEAALTVEAASAASWTGPSRLAAGPALVIFPFNGILHIDTREALLDAFSHVRSRLAGGGRFAFDTTGPYWNVMLAGACVFGRVDARVHPTTGARLLTCDRSVYDVATRQMHIFIRFATVDGDAKQRVEIELIQRMWTWQELAHALDQTGFELEHAYGDVDLRPFDEGSQRLMACARARP